MRARVVHPLAVLVTVFIFGSSMFGEAQQPRPGVRPTGGRATVGADYVGPTTGLLKIRRLEGVARAGIVRTPQYQNGSGGTKPPQDWVEIKTTFDTEPEWIEEVVFQYYILTRNNRKDEKVPYSFYQATVRYGDVERGRNHYSTMYIPPNAVKRHGYPVALGVEILINGKIVDSKHEKDPSVGVAAEWWKNPEVISKEGVATRPGCLINRKESPFALINIDDYEVVR